MSWNVRNITVRYGHTVAVDEVSFAVEPGHVHSVIGGDGAGKSTLLKVLAGLDIGQTGTVRLPASNRIGYVPSDGGIFGDLTVDENIEFVAHTYRLRNWRDRADDLLARAAIGQFGDRIAGRMSGGQRRKLAGCMALLPRPELLVLDEVTTGVDPVSRMELWRLVAGAAADGAAVVAATTYLDEAERTEEVLLLHDGRVLAAGPPASVVASVPGRVHTLDQPSEPGNAWRSGRRWRQWSPATDGPFHADLTLEDAAIVLELRSADAAAQPSPHTSRQDTPS
ncbi:MAG TPA: ABC transporter ATP-binding protein [Ilumatobacteraceae bacterium]|nr:ABC transporter ATP-binding protein [Ilumatobacteraceae bacterium]